MSQKHADPGSNPGWGTRIFGEPRANGVVPAYLHIDPEFRISQFAT
jgi:hypothetical protein